MSTPDDARDSDSPDQDDAQEAPASPAGDAKDDVAAGVAGVKKKDGGSEDVTKQDVAKPVKKKAGKDPDRKGLLARFRLFLRQVMAELRKVIWPTRSELINYTAVVLVFVVIMAMILAAYDFAFARAVFFVFDN